MCDEWTEQCKTWTAHDDELWEKGVVSGTAYNKYTNKPLTLSELKELCKDWDAVRDIMSIDDFIEKRIVAKCHTCGAEMIEGHNHIGDGWKKRHYDIARESDEMRRNGTQGKEIDI